MTERDAASLDQVMIEITAMHKWFGPFHVLKDINLKVMAGERIVICGPSGSGKSTLIRCINRLETHQQGGIVVDGTELTRDVKNIETIRSEVGMVFQHFNLFPHLTVLENCTLAPIWVRKMPKREASGSPCASLNEFRSPSRPPSIRGSFPAGSSSASPSPARSACSPASCCSTSRRRPSIRR